MNNFQILQEEHEARQNVDKNGVADKNNVEMLELDGKLSLSIIIEINRANENK
jgi:hypothetical protein